MFFFIGKSAVIKHHQLLSKIEKKVILDNVKSCISTSKEHIHPLPQPNLNRDCVYFSDECMDDAFSCGYGGTEGPRSCLQSSGECDGVVECASNDDDERECGMSTTGLLTQFLIG